MRVGSTIIEVARAAGVSTATVSNALNGTGRASAATRDRVRAVAESLGYRPNAAGRTLRTGRSGVLALAVTTFGDRAWNYAEVPYYAHVVAAATAAAHSRGYALIVLPTGLVEADWHGVVADGVVLLDSPADDPAVRVLGQRGIPIAYDGEPHATGPRDSWVDNDHVATTARVLDHLRAQGAQRIGLLAQATSDRYTQAVVAAYRAQVATPYIRLVEDAEWTGRSAAEELLRDGVDAVYGLLDRCGHGILAATQSLGLSVPEDVLVVTASEDPVYAATTPTVSTVSLSPEETITAAIDALVSVIAGGEPTIVTHLRSTLHIRDSSLRR